MKGHKYVDTILAYILLRLVGWNCSKHIEEMLAKSEADYSQVDPLLWSFISDLIYLNMTS